MKRLANIRALLATSLLALLVASAFAATGQGATASEQVTVPITVPAATYLDASTCIALPTATDLGDVGRNATVVTTTSCPISFGASNDATVALRVEDPAVTPGMRSGANTIPDVTTPGGMLNGFGYCAVNASGTAASNIGTGTCTGGSTGWYAPEPTPRTIATTSTTSGGALNLRFGVTTTFATPPGAYLGTMTFTVIA